MARILIGNIKGPKGNKGDKGDQGPIGPQGPAGAKGEKGDMPALVNNALTTEAGIAALDAAMGKNLQGQITQLNSDISDSGWITFTPTGKFKKYQDSSICRYRKVGKIVEVIGAVTPTETIPGSGTREIFFTLPEEYRPVYEVTMICQGTGSNRWAFSITTNGQCGVSRYGITEFEDIEPGNWLIFQAMFFTA